MRNHKASRVLDPKTHFADAASAARENVLEMRDAAKDLARGQLGKLSAGVTSLRERAAAKVEESPLKSVLIALGAGLVLGVFLGRR